MDGRIKKFILLVGDTAVFYLTLYFTLLLRYQKLPAADVWLSHFWPFTLIFFGWITIFYISNLYDLNKAVNDSHFFQSALRAVTFGGIISALYFYLNADLGIAPKTNLLIFLALFIILFIIWRRTFNWLIGTYLSKDNVAFVGYNGQAHELISYLKKNPHLGYHPALVIQESLSDAVSDIPVTNKIDELARILAEHKISVLILVSDPQQSSRLRAFLFDCLPLKLKFISLPHFYEAVTGKIPIEAINQMWFMENLSEGNKTAFDAAKRIYDIILGVLIFAITLPFWLLIAIAIKAGSPGPVFYIGDRSGRNGKKFRLYKFRTMREIGNDRSPTKSGDPRVTPFGNFMRKTRLDEIPQVLNIIKGEMSFVGPRPERPELIAELETVIPYYNERMLVKPGLTGWDQISGEYHSPSREDTLKKLQYDLFYIKNRSIYLDLSIILKTIATVLSRAGI